MRLPNLNALRMFDASARHCNFRLAAEELHLTQGAVAQQVRRLESDLGLKLFDRKARGLALTQIGREFHAPIRQAFALIEEAAQKLSVPVRQVTLNVTPSFAAKWLVPHLAEFTRSQPEIDIQVVASEQRTRFNSGGAEIAIRQAGPPFDESLHVELLTTLDLRAVCSPGFVDKDARFDELGNFVGHALIQDGQCHWDRLFKNTNQKIRPRYLQFNRTALAMDAAATGQGIALAPRLLVDSDIAAGRLVELWRSPSKDQYGFYIVHPNAAKPNRDREAVIQWVRSEIRPSLD